MNTDNKKILRQQLSKVTQTTISPARIRRFMDGLGINRDIEDRLAVLKSEILKIKKEDGPLLPTTPELLKKDSTDPQKVKYEEDKNKYNADLKKYNDYVSERYVRLKTIYNLCKLLNKVHILLLKEKRNVNQNQEIIEYTNLIKDNPSLKKQKETDDEFKNRTDKFVSSGYLNYITNVDLTDADDIQKLMMKLKMDNDGVSIFLQKDEISRTRIRFNDPSAVALATVMELGIEELLEHGMDQTLLSQKKTIQPDHCVSPGLENCVWYVLFKDLPHLKAIVDRQKRKIEYNNDKEKDKQKAILKAKSKAKKDKKPYVRPKSTYLNFQETEVNKKFALKTDIVTIDSAGVSVSKPNYQWYGIDLDDTTDNETANFYFYVHQVCKKIINRRSDSGNTEFMEIKISTNIRKFFSDLIIDFIARISPQIRILIDAMDVKTIDHQVVKTVLKMLLVYNTHNSKGLITMDAEYDYLFKLIDEKVELCKVHQTGYVDKLGATENQIKDDDDDVKGHLDDPTEDIIKNDHSTENGKSITKKLTNMAIN